MHAKPKTVKNFVLNDLLVIWRKLTGNLEEDNLMLNEWLENTISTQVSEFDFIYFNGSNNLPNLRQDHKYQKTCLIEETFHQYMSDVEV